MTNPFANLTRNPAPAAPAPAAPARTQAAAAPAAPAAPVAAAPAAPAPVPAAVTTVQAAAAPSQPVTLSVVTGHSSGGAQAIMAGVVGRNVDGVFTIEPIYKKLGYLFTLADKGAIDGMGDEMTNGITLSEVTLPSEAAANEFVINMIATNSGAWDAMYDNVGASMGKNDVVHKMLMTEKAMMKESALRVIGEAALGTYNVPVSYEVIVPQMYAGDRAGVTTDKQLIAIGNLVPFSVEANQTGPVPTLAGQGNAADAEVDSMLSEENLQHDGAFDLQVGGNAQVLASSPESAQITLAQLIFISRQTTARNVLTLAPVLINNTTLNPYETHDDYERE